MLSYQVGKVKCCHISGHRHVLCSDITWPTVVKIFEYQVGRSNVDAYVQLDQSLTDVVV